MRYMETIGASCQNCGSRGEKGCTQKCLDSDYSRWEPAPGVKIHEYDVWYGKKKGIGRRVLKREEWECHR